MENGPVWNQEQGARQQDAVGWLYIDFDSFFASVEQHHNPALRGQPVAVVPVLSDSTCAIAASYEAKAYGIKTGTMIYEARRRCPHLRLVLAGHGGYVRMHKAIVDLVETECMPVAAVCSIDEIACRLTGSERRPALAAARARMIKEVLAARISPFIRCSIGIAPNRFLAKLASDMEKPNGLTVLTDAGLPQNILRLKLTDLPGVGPNMLRRLQAAGVGDMAALWALPPAALRGIWGGVEGERFWMHLHGQETAERLTERSSIGHSRVLDPALRNPAAAHEVMRHLVVKAAKRLRAEMFTARTFWLGARPANAPRFIARMKVHPCADTFRFLEAADILWQRMLEEARPHAIRKVSVTLTDLLPESDVTRDLFDSAPRLMPAMPAGGAPGTRESLARAVDRLQARYGSEAVTYGWKAKKLDAFGTKIAFTRVPELDEFDDV